MLLHLQYFFKKSFAISISCKLTFGSHTPHSTYDVLRKQARAPPMLLHLIYVFKTAYVIAIWMQVPLLGSDSAFHIQGLIKYARAPQCSIICSTFSKRHMLWQLYARSQLLFIVNLSNKTFDKIRYNTQCSFKEGALGDLPNFSNRDWGSAHRSSII